MASTLCADNQLSSLQRQRDSKMEVMMIMMIMYHEDGSISRFFHEKSQFRVEREQLEKR